MGLLQDGQLDVLVAGRDLAAATRFCALNGGRAVQFDRDAPDMQQCLQDIAPEIVIDAAGPFQSYGSDPYRVVRAALAAGAHYLDLSDDAGFTAGIATLDATAKAAGRTVLSGVSSVPALSSAAVTELAKGLTDIHLIESTILPGNRAPRGLSVMRAILGQAGQPLTLWRGGQWTAAPGWGQARTLALSAPMAAMGFGQNCLPQRPASLIGAPDLVLFPAYFDARSVVFRAGLELRVMHYGLTALSWLVRLHLLKTLVPLARPLRWAADRLYRFGSDRGGMRVRVLGITTRGQPECRDWTLIAGAGDGPHIPAIPAQVMVARLLAGTAAHGARPCLAEFSLHEATDAMASLNIHHARQDASMPFVFKAVLGPAFEGLPDGLRDLHHVLDTRRWQGRAKITRGRHPLSRLIGAVMGFPAAGADVPVTVTMQRRGKTETWTRDFAGSRFRSHLSAREGGGITERFGPLSFDIDLAVQGNKIAYPLMRGRCLGIPMPRWALPRSDTHEQIDGEGRASFDVAISMPLVGPVVRYQGWLTPI